MPINIYRGSRRVPRGTITIRPKQIALSTIGKAVRGVCSFDGIDDRGQLAFKAINIDATNTIVFWTGDSNKETQVIISQNVSSTFNAREFQMWTAAFTTQLKMLVGGVENTIGNVLPNTRYSITFDTGSFTLRLASTNAIVATGILTRGTFREDGATTRIACNTDGAGTANHYKGRNSGITINGITWLIKDTRQDVQLPESPALGANIVNPASIVWEEGAAVPSRRQSGSLIAFTGVDTWGQRPFYIPIPVAANMAYLVECDVTGVSDGFDLRILLTDRLGGGTPAVVPTTWPAELAAVFDTSSAFYGSFFPMRVRGGKARCLVYLPNTAISTWYLSVRPAINMNNQSITINNLSMRPLWSVEGIERVTNGDFSGGTTGWAAQSGGSIGVTSGQATLTTVAAQASRFEQSVTVEANAYYLVMLDVISLTSVTRAAVQIIRGAAGNYASVAFSQRTSPGKIAVVFRAPATDVMVQVYGDSTNAGSVVVDNVSIRKLPTICNPMTLVNVTTERWSEVSL